MKERLELVTDFGTLRVGMIVKVKYEGKLHRFFLLRKEPLDGVHVVRFGVCDCFVVLPNMAPSAQRSVLTTEHVYRNMVYRVIDDIEKTQSTSSRKSVTA